MAKIRKNGYMREAWHEIKYIFLNYFVTNIPIWPIRKMFYLVFGMKIGKKSRILMKTVVVNPENIEIGDHSYINEKCFLDGRGGITIGNNVTIAIYSKLITGYHDIDDDFFSYKKGHIIIGDNAAIFADSVILAGVELKKGCVISARSLVRKGFYKENGVYAGNPASFIRNRKSKSEYIQDHWHPLFR